MSEIEAPERVMRRAEAASVLTEEQQQVVDSGLLDGSAVLSVCTSWGKTWMARLAIKRVVAGGGRAVYLCPLVAIARELGSAWRQEFAGARLGVYTGEVQDEFDDEGPAVRDADVVIATPEKLDWFLRAWESNLGWLARVELLVVDEVHNLGGGHRGAVLEGVIGRLKAVNPFVRVMALSATLGNPHQLATWLGAGVFESRNRPVPLSWEIEPFKTQEDKQRIAIERCTSAAAAGGQAIVFVQSRSRAVSLAQVLVEAGLRAAPHHAGLSRTARSRTEGAFRSRSLDAVVATPTLAQGVNLPAKVVLLYDLARWEADGWSDLSVSEVWQLAGRAGRKGIDTRGEAVLLAPKWNQKTAREYLKGRFEPVRSQVLARRRSLCEQILVIFGSRLARTEVQACRALDRMLIGQEMGGEGQRDGSALTKLVCDATQSMVVAGMLSRDDEGRLKATRLGRIAVRFQLSPETVLAWNRLCERLTSPCFFDLLLAVCASPDFTGGMRCEAEDLALLQAAFDREPSAIKGWAKDERGEVLPVRGRGLVVAVQRAVALRAWTRDGDAEAAAVEARCQPHDVEEVRREALRLLQALQALVGSRIDQAATGNEADVKDGDLQLKLLALRAMVSAGMDGEQATLALVDGIGPVMARRLVQAGISDVEDLALADEQDLSQVEGVSLRRALCWKEDAEQWIAKGGAFMFREAPSQAASRTDGTTAARMARGLDYFRWLRASQLQVELAGERQWKVSGGAEAHLVLHNQDEGYTCDCKDAGKGRLCKHQIAVRHAKEDPEIPRFEAGMGVEAGEAGGTLDLAALWGMRA